MVFNEDLHIEENTQPHGVVVDAYRNKNFCRSCSGIKIENWVITHGTILLPFTKDEISDLHLGMNSSEIFFEILIKKDNLSSTSSNELKNSINREIGFYNATVVGLYKNQELSQIIKETLPCWSYSKSKEENRSIVKKMSVFLLLKIDDLSTDNKSHKVKLERESFQLGMDILIESTPFAATSFYNSWSRGVVSKVLDTDNQLVLIDSRTSIGCEGAPIYSYHNGKQRNLIGMVLCVLNWWHGELVGFTLGYSIFPIIKYFNIIQTIPKAIETKIDLDTLKSAVVFIRNGDIWGSGVVIDSAKGVVLTCAHIIKNPESPVLVVHSLLENQSLPAKVVYATPKDKPFDIAVLRITPNCGLQQLDLTNSLPIKGDEILSAGYSLCSEHCSNGQLGITVSQGTIACVDNSGPLHTTSFVHPGASGGAIMKPPNQLLGIILCNSMVDGRVLPEFSMGVSTNNFYQPLKQYLDTDDPECLNMLTVTDNKVIKKWSQLFVASKL